MMDRGWERKRENVWHQCSVGIVIWNASELLMHINKPTNKNIDGGHSHSSHTHGTIADNTFYIRLLFAFCAFVRGVIPAPWDSVTYIHTHTYHTLSTRIA